MQPSKVREAPDARNNANMQFFNMAVHTLADMKEHQDAMVCFNLHYVEQADNIKRRADELGISRPRITTAPRHTLGRHTLFRKA
ncbi:hypothetical protein GJV26_15985 [Massilia dura]|uniref:Uncharacterized protein n=1 Tax=Pseudoduganella dura TaxID=321982 RepID=A0A6I3XL57_9BURK|nr:hypothetical protein [Pseudoduganella dura]MUI13942.1 hypothetical protein [Pseudoduganella dura]GGX98940.1 hypothetical protein GCM10007386_32290 [Pseudoduganella dura]